MGTPSDQFLHLLWRPPYVFLFILYGGPSDHFFAYYIGPPRSLSLLTMWGPSDLFLLIQYGGPSQISFIAYYMPPPLRSVSLHAIGGPPHIYFFSQNNDFITSDQFLRLLYEVPSNQLLCILFGRPSQISFFSYYMGSLSDQFFLLLYGPPQISFFAYYMGGPSDQFLRLLYGDPLRSVSLLNI